MRQFFYTPQGFFWAKITGFESRAVTMPFSISSVDASRASMRSESAMPLSYQWVVECPHKVQASRQQNFCSVLLYLSASLSNVI
ncbi:MAG: hypothetical protein EZS28_008913 [Streblomastix strix]|uniref:Uncharacterized protein n=1 Tax=Streblomastix strix TaxID=222440 RepID=A0A5J4WL20_9EUKA|nr:MAG: hypothetical protein EZS28_008913 [Streblomastix strix]